MMPVNVTNFLHSLAKAIAVACSIPFPGTIDAAHKAAIWAGEAIESLATDPFTTLVDYGGSAPEFNQATEIAVQVATMGTVRDAVRDRAWAVYQALRASDGRPWRSATIAGIVPTTQAADGTWRVIKADFVQPPGFVGGPDEQGRVMCAFSMDVRFVKVV